MKIRSDFVTNSSSSSFIISKKDITDSQLKIMRKPYKKALELEMCEWGDPYEWGIKEHNGNIIGWTNMDNFDWIKFMLKIGINENDIIQDKENQGSGSWGLNMIMEYEKENNCSIMTYDKTDDNWFEPDEEYKEYMVLPIDWDELWAEFEDGDE